jgi:hypothetical protein
VSVRMRVYIDAGEECNFCACVCVCVCVCWRDYRPICIWSRVEGLHDLFWFPFFCADRWTREKSVTFVCVCVCACVCVCDGLIIGFSSVCSGGGNIRSLPALESTFEIAACATKNTVIYSPPPSFPPDLIPSNLIVFPRGCLHTTSPPLVNTFSNPAQDRGGCKNINYTITMLTL